MKFNFRNSVLLISLVFFITLVFFSSGALAQEQIPIAQQVSSFYKWALGIGGLVALGVIVYGGILYIISAGNASKQDDAKGWILGAIIGLFLLFGSFLILNTINPELTKLSKLTLKTNDPAPDYESPPPRDENGGPLPPGDLPSPADPGAKRISLNEAGIACTSGCNPVRRPEGCALLQEHGVTCDASGRPPGGNCDTELNRTLVNNLKAMDQVLASKGLPPLFITSSVCGVHAPESYHYRLRAVDISIAGRADTELTAIMQILGATSCVNDIWGPVRFGRLCRDEGRLVHCAIEGGHEDHIHYDVATTC